MPSVEESIATLSALPVALLPVRIETRFPPDTDELRIRVYPDQVHLDAHRPGLTEAEVVAGQAYWRARWTGAGDAAWLDLTRGLRPARATWVVRATTPTNLDEVGSAGGATFPTPELAADVDLGAYATVSELPAQWLVLGYRDGAEVLRATSKPVRPDLVVGLGDVGADDDTDSAAPLTGPAAWAADYEVAVAAGMAVTIPLADVPEGITAERGLDRLVVLGVGAGDDRGASGADALDRLLSAHQVTDGLALLRWGSATNDSATERPTTSRAPVVDPETGSSAGPGGALRADLGLAAGSMLDQIPLAGAGTTPPDAVPDAERAAAAMVDAVWSATLGYALEQMMWPAVGRDATQTVRTHARNHLRPRGRHPVLQIGRQPYGVLPVVATGHLVGDAVPAGLRDVPRRLLPMWSAAAANLPRLAPAAPIVDHDVDATLFQVLRRAPESTSYRYRDVLGPMLATNTAGTGGAALLQSQVRDLVLTDVLETAQPARIRDFVAFPGCFPIRVPQLVGAGVGPLEPNYLRTIVDTLPTADARTALADAGPTSLLHALVNLSAVHEIDRAVAMLAARHAPPDFPFRDLPWVTPELAGVTAASSWSPRLLADLTLPDVGMALRIRVSQLLADPDDPDAEVVEGLRALLRAVQTLSTMTVPTLEGAVIGLLDAFSHRLDAWFTSLANAQLAAVRRTSSEGVHLGAYGWVDDVRPEDRPDSAGYLLAASPAHANAAAVLRSGYLTHAGPAGHAFDVDLTSTRAERALEAIRAISAGVGLRRVLGYEIERRLHDLGMQHVIQRLRTLAPMNPPPTPFTSDPPPLDPDTLDGVMLIEQEDLIGGRLFGEPAEVHNAVNAEVIRLKDLFDAIADLTTAESVYQLVLGRPERVRAALTLIDRQDPAPEPEITQTPIAGHALVQRVLVTLTESEPALGWAAVARDSRAVVEPRLDRWAGQLLGRPTEWSIAGEVLDAEENVVASGSITLVDLGMSPLAVVLATVPGPGGGTVLEERAARALVSDLGPIPADGRVDLLSSAGGGGARGLAALLAHAGAIRRVFELCRPADATAFTRPSAVADAGVDVAELTARADDAVAAYESAHDALASAMSAPTPQQDDVRDALDRVDAAGVPGAIAPLAAMSDAGPGGVATAELMALATSVATAMTAARERLDVLDAAPAAVARTVAHQRARIAIVLGAAMPVLPVFRVDPDAADDLASAAARQAVLTGGDALAATTWLTQTSRVREPVAALWRVLLAAEVGTGGFAPAQAVVAHRPIGPDDAWIGGSQETGGQQANREPAADTSFVLIAPSGRTAVASAAAAGGDGVAALVVDAWSELIPSAAQTAGVAFQYDAPGNRAPQAVLLAVPPDLEGGRWTADQLIDTVLEAAELTAIRPVTLGDIPAAGPLLPAIYLPFSLGPEVYGIDLAQWAVTSADQVVLGSH